MITGIIDVGGGYRDIFGAGVLDGLLKISNDAISHDEVSHDAIPENQTSSTKSSNTQTLQTYAGSTLFTHCYGISAGSGNLSSFLSGQYKRNYRFYMEYAFRRRYASMRNLFRNHNFVGLDYAYGTLSNSGGEYPLNYPALRDNPSTFIIVASNALTGQAHYFDKSDLHQDDYSPIMASSCVPVANQPVIINDVPYYDGGLTDPVPVQRAFDDGCEKVVLITTHPLDFVRDSRKDIAPAQLVRRSYPAAADALLNRANIYNLEIELARHYADQGRLLIVAPNDTYGLNTLSKTRQGLLSMYNDGVTKAQLVQQFLEGDNHD